MHKGAIRDALPQGNPLSRALADRDIDHGRDSCFLGKESSLLSPFCRHNWGVPGCALERQFHGGI